MCAASFEQRKQAEGAIKHLARRMTTLRLEREHLKSHKGLPPEAGEFWEQAEQQVGGFGRSGDLQVLAESSGKCAGSQEPATASSGALPPAGRKLPPDARSARSLLSPLWPVNCKWPVFCKALTEFLRVSKSAI